ncbi:MAG: hypothetical protein PHD21_08850 [Flavobacteriales bacterium]|nr:hypothetical protein [Flavobacteriales bacterium]
MKTKLTLLKNALFVALGVFALTSCSKDPSAMAYGYKDLAGNFKDGTTNFRPNGSAAAPYGGTMVTYTTTPFTVEEASVAGGQALRFIANHDSYTVDVTGVYTEKKDMMVFKATGVRYTHKGIEYTGDLIAKCKPNGINIEIGNYTPGDAQQGALFRYSTRFRDTEVVEEAE